MNVLALQLDHQDCSHARDAPADTDVGAAVHLAYEVFEDAGAELGAALVPEEESA